MTPRPPLQDFDSQLGFPGEGPYTDHHNDRLHDGRTHLGETFEHIYATDRAFVTRALTWSRAVGSRAAFQAYARERRAAEQALPPLVQAAQQANNAAPNPPAPRDRPQDDVPANQSPWLALGAALEDHGLVQLRRWHRTVARFVSGRQILIMSVFLLVAPSVAGAAAAFCSVLVTNALLAALESFCIILASRAPTLAAAAELGARVAAQARALPNHVWYAISLAAFDDETAVASASHLLYHYGYYYYFPAHSPPNNATRALPLPPAQWISSYWRGLFAGLHAAVVAVQPIACWVTGRWHCAVSSLPLACVTRPRPLREPALAGHDLL